MLHPRKLPTISFLSLLSACGARGRSGVTAGTPADVIFTNDKIYTIDPVQPRAEAVAV